MTRRIMVLVLLCATSGARVAAQSGPPSAWTGTVEVVRQGSMSEEMGGADVSGSFTQQVQYTLQLDGSASYTATHDETLTITNEGYSATMTITGRGSGATPAGVELLEGGPLTELLGFSNGWAISAGSVMMLVHRDMPNEDYFGGAYLPIGLGGHLEDEAGEQGAPGVAIPTGSTQSTKTLSGSVTSQGQGYNLSFPMTGTERVTYNLTRVALDPTPRVAIHGPPCGCLDPDDPSRIPLRFMATASHRGGEFSAFTVTPDGEAPEVLYNAGGESAEPELAGANTTGAVTLNVEYLHEGRVYAAAPFRVEFCTLDRLELAGDQTDIAFDLDQKLIVTARGRAWHNGTEVSRQVAWDIEPMGAPTSLEARPSSRLGGDMTFTYVGLPERNSDFGEKVLTARYTGGNCVCERTKRIRAFYLDVDDGHPGADGSPNWFYYWKQTRAVDDAARPRLRYQSTIGASGPGGANVLALFDHEADSILISDRILYNNGCRGEVDPVARQTTGRQAQGIDCFGETVAHELQHRADAIEWWGSARGPFGAIGAGVLADPDTDHVPSLVEIDLPGCSPTSSMSCDARPFDDVTDAEIRAYYAGWQWQLGSANQDDWSCGERSKQWKGRGCP